MKMNFDSNTCSLDGIFLIEASAGTGKTYNIQNLAVRLILEKDLKIDQILIVTFTRAATAELSDRIRKILQSCQDFLAILCGSDETVEFPEGFSREKALLAGATEGFRREKNIECRKKLQEALQDFDNNAISTIDGFCQRMLSRNAFESGILFETVLMDTEVSEELICHLLRNKWRKICYDPGNVYAGLARGIIDLDHYFAELTSQAPDEFFLQIKQVPFSTKPNRIGIHDLIEHPEIDYDTAPIGELPEEIAGKTVKKLRELSVLLERIRGDLTPPEKVEIPPVITDFPDKTGTELWEKFSEHRGELETGFTGKDPALQKEFFSGLSELKTLMQDLRVQLIRKIRQEAADDFLRLKDQENFQTFRDLQRRMTEALDQSPALRAALRNQFKAAIIDEFQDTDQVQYKIFMEVFSPAPARLFLVGDPKQAIYAFRGGDIFTYKQAASEIRKLGEDHILSLNTNYRSADQLIRSVNHIFSDHSLPFADPEIEFQPSEVCGKQPMLINGIPDPSPLHFLDSEELNGNMYSICAEKILSLLNGDVQIPDPEEETRWKKLTPSDIAILFRGLKLHAEGMTEALRQKGIPFVVLEDLSLFDAQEAKDMLHLLEAVLKPGDIQNVLLFMQTNFSGTTSCRDLLPANKSDIKELINETQQKLFIIGKIFLEKGFLRAFTCFADLFSIHSSLLSLPDGAQRYANLLQLRDVLLREERNGNRTAESMIAWLKQQINPQTRTEHSENIVLASDAPAVRIMTVHKSKGLQFPAVFLPDLSESEIKESKSVNYHDPLQANRTVKSTPRSEIKSPLPHLEALQEEIRIAYVALTRASRACYLVLKKNPDLFSAINWLLLGRNIFANGEIAPSRLISSYKELVQSAAQETLPEEFQTIETVPGTDDLYLNPPFPELKPHRWTAQVPQPPAKLSYSEIHRYYRKKYDLKSSGEEEIPAELPMITPLTGKETPSPDKLPDVFTLPKGDLFGNACHTILEHLDFQNPVQLKELIRRHLASVNIGEKLPIAEQMFRNVLTAPIPCDGCGSFTLQEIPFSDRCSEIEFDFQDSAGFHPGKLAKLINDTFLEEQNRYSLSPLHPVIPAVFPQAFYTGTADLICRAKGKYYIIDWKTDILGNDFSNFQPEHLFQPMWEKFYLYQSLLYSSAFLKYLSFRTGEDPGTLWKEQFGGVRYLFLRGMDPAHPGRGIFSSKPDLELIRKIAGDLS